MTAPKAPLFPAFALAALLSLSAAASSRQTLPDSLPRDFAATPRLGDLDPSTPMDLDLCLAPPDPAALNAFISALYDPRSPNYRRFLSPQEFADRFGPGVSDYRALQDFARAQGLTVVATHSNRLLVQVRGDAAHVERAFHVSLGRRRRADGSAFYAPDDAPSVDLGLSGLDVYGLDNYARWRRLSRRRARGARRRPAGGTGGEGSGAFQGYDFRDAYAPGVNLEGAGQTVGLVEFGGFSYADITAYAATSDPALPSNFNVQTELLFNYDGSPMDNGDSGFSEGDCSEVSLDIELALAMAPQAEILSFEAPTVDSADYSPTLGDVLSSVVDVTYCAQVSCSWIGGPMGDAAGELSSMATEGQAFFQASGDNGAYGTAAEDVAGPIPDPQCVSPYITVVGGTDLNPGTGSNAATPPIPYLSETTWNDFAGSCADFSNDSCENCTGGASGGGVCNGTNSVSVLGLPAYQSGVSMATNGGSTTYRNIPDVSALAENFWVTWCTQCTDDGEGYAGAQAGAFDGTSGASPLWAAFMALVNEQIASEGTGRLGFANPALYRVGESAGYNSAFHDISDGSNNDIVGNGRHDCDKLSYTAVEGYDLATGWGSPNGAALINALAGTVFSPTATPTQTPTPTSSDSPTVTASPTITPTFTASPTVTDSPTITETFTVTQTPEYLESGLGRTILVNNPARGGEPVVLYFGQRPAATRWRVYDLAARLVESADIVGAGPHEVSTQNLATGVYFARVNVDYASGGSQTLMLKFAVIR